MRDGKGGFYIDEPQYTTSRKTLGPHLHFGAKPVFSDIPVEVVHHDTTAAMGSSHAVYLALIISHQGLKDHFKGLHILIVQLFFSWHTILENGHLMK